MTLLLDLGNTRLKTAWLRDGAPDDIAHFALDDDDLPAAFGAWLARSRDSNRRASGVASERFAGVATQSLTRAHLAAVAPDETVTRIAALLAAHRIDVSRVTTQVQAFGVRIAYRDPSRFGVDRWLNLVAAHRRLRAPVLVASVGTALTVDALLADGTHLGGLIAATPDAARAALVARAPRLAVPRGDVARFAASTEDAIESGAVLGATALIERSLHELERLAHAPATLLLTGGGAAPLRPWLGPHERIDDLVLHGLAAWSTGAGG